MRTGSQDQCYNKKEQKDLINILVACISLVFVPKQPLQYMAKGTRGELPRNPVKRNNHFKTSVSSRVPLPSHQHFRAGENPERPQLSQTLKIFKAFCLTKATASFPIRMQMEMD